MAIIACKECGNEVSNKALKCPSCGVQLRKPKRGIMGTLFKWLFILFNILMAAWLASYFGIIGETMSTAKSDAEQAGAAIGGTLGTGMLLTLWVMGDIIIGLFVLFTRPK